MAVHSNTFGGLQLSGADAKKFRNQVTFGKPNAAAHRSASKGVSTAAKLLENGHVKIAKSIA